MRLGVCLAVAAAAAACGKKGPPLAPLHLVPEGVKDVVARRTGGDMRLRFVLPAANLNGGGPVQLDRVEIYAVTAAPGAAVPSNRELLSDTYRVGTIAVKPAPVEGEPLAPDAAADTRPGPGATVDFVEALTAEKLTPAKLPVVPPPATPAAPAATPAVAAPTYSVRVYVIRGMTRSGRGGQPSARVTLPLVDPPSPPADAKASFTETAISLVWTASPEPSAATYNVYEPEGTTPLNASPLASPAYEQPGVEFGAERCFVVRTVETVATIPIESSPSPAACVTPTDVFPPVAPKGLSAVPTEGAMNLSWQASPEADLAGYVVLRGEAPGERLQPLTAEPITSTRYEDKSVRSGVRYVYVVVAVDRGTPANTSAQSNRVEETAR